MTNRTKWTEYTGSDEQIAEISSSKNGFVCRNNETDSGVLTIKYGQLFSDQSDYPILNAMWNGSLKRFVETNNTTHLWIIPDDPLREIKIRQSQTGQPVWIKICNYDWKSLGMEYQCSWDNDDFTIFETTKPNWNIPGAEYRFTPFGEEK